MTELHRIIIVGAGFGGMQLAQKLKNAKVQITLIDKQNYHLFQPLLYQTATALLSPSEIAWPIRYLTRKRPDITTLLAKVTDVDKDKRQVIFENGDVMDYDTLILATGARHAYFGNDEWAQYAPGLKVLDDATGIRQKILLAFEKAEREPDAEERAALLTFAIIGGGPTGVELAGTIAELAHFTLAGEFRTFDVRDTRVMLIEAADRVLPLFREKLSVYAHEALLKLGVEVELGTPVTQCNEDGVIYGAKELKTRTILWAAGVQASNAATWLNTKADRVNRVLVEKDLSVTGHPEIFVIGDTAAVFDAKGKPVPGVAPAAKQQGKYVAKIIKARLNDKEISKPFKYQHFGDLATIGKRAAVFDLGWMTLKGSLAWLLWGVAHIYFLIGVRNRITVVMSWLWIYFNCDRGARLITRIDVSADPTSKKIN